MKLAAVLRAINRNLGIHACVLLFFGYCWFFHHVALSFMEEFHRQFRVANDTTLRAMALIDLVADNRWLAVAYFLLIAGCVGFLQFRGRPRWTCWLTVLVFCAPMLLYWNACAYIVCKLL